jgi:hypothetical protein
VVTGRTVLWVFVGMAAREAVATIAEVGRRVHSGAMPWL